MYFAARIIIITLIFFSHTKNYNPSFHNGINHLNNKIIPETNALLDIIESLCVCVYFRLTLNNGRTALPGHTVTGCQVSPNQKRTRKNA